MRVDALKKAIIAGNHNADSELLNEAAKIFCDKKESFESRIEALEINDKIIGIHGDYKMPESVEELNDMLEDYGCKLID